MAQQSNRDLRVELPESDADSEAKAERERRRAQRSPRRRRGLTNEAPRIYVGFQQGLVPCPAINSSDASSSQLPPQSRIDEPLPASVGQGNFMIANWAVGQEVDPIQVAENDIGSIRLCHNHDDIRSRGKHPDCKVISPP